MKRPHIHPHHFHGPHIHPENLKAALKHTWDYFLAAVKWLPAAALTGAAGGLVGVAFHHAIHAATAYRESHPWVLYLLPFGAMLILLIYRGLRISASAGTNLILEAVNSRQKVPLLLAPAILLGTVATHFFGGSAGREGAALQIGGSVASGIAKLLRVKRERDRHLLILCGMAAVFSALFGTPVTAVLFVLEVVSVGTFFYSAILSCLTASLAAYWVNRLLGGEAVRLAVVLPGGVTPLAVAQTAGLAVLTAILSIAFCVVVHRAGHYTAKWIKNPYFRAFLLGAGLLGLTLLAGDQTYNGAGMAFVERAVAGDAIPWYAFLLKLVFTAVTLAAGYKGGEIVPTFFVGATFGAVAGPLLGLDPGFAAAVGMVGLFCGVINCPIASICLAVEVFGGEYLIPWTLTCALSYVLSGYFGLYSSQHILRSKVGTELIDRNTIE